MKETSRECQRYQELQDLNLALDLVVIEVDGKEQVIYEVIEEFFDNTHETKTFKKFVEAELHYLTTSFSFLGLYLIFSTKAKATDAKHKQQLVQPICKQICLGRTGEVKPWDFKD